LIFGDVATPSYGATFTNSSLDQKYAIFGTSLQKTFNRHTVKIWLGLRAPPTSTARKPMGSRISCFATQADYEQFGPIDAGFFLL